MASKKKTTEEVLPGEAPAEATAETPAEEKPKKIRRKKEVFTEEQLASPRTDAQFRLVLKRTTRAYYDLQAMRLQLLGRLTKKAPGAEIELHPADLNRLQVRLVDLETAEKNMLVDLEALLNQVPFYKNVMLPKRTTQYRGLGPRMASIILSSFDIAREDTVSKMWAFAGLRPMPCERCVRCFVPLTLDEASGQYKHSKPPGNKCELAGGFVPNDQLRHSARAQRPVAGEKLNYNAWLRSKLCGVLGEVLIKVGSPYRSFYDNYKLRWQESNKGTSDAHRHRAATRFMIKMLLLDIWKEWRTFEGLPVRPSYAEEYLGKKHHESPVKPTPPPVVVDFNPVDQEIADELAALEQDTGT